MSEITLGILLGATPTAFLVTGGIIHELRLRATCRRGWLQTYGITGKPADMELQVRDLRDRHAMAAEVDGRHVPDPFPTRREGDDPR